MFNLILVPHKDLSQKNLDEIIQVKSIAWPYHYEKQLEWINSNLNDTDIHVLLYLDESLVAYLNLIEIEFTIDGNLKHGYGIGNVCAKAKGKGWGKEIMIQTNTYLSQLNTIGLLFCRATLVDFYKNYNWKLIDRAIINLSFQSESIETLIFNLSNKFQAFEYIGKSF